MKWDNVTIAIRSKVEYLRRISAQLKKQVQTNSGNSWWEKITGTFADNSDFDEAMELGKEYRQEEEFLALAIEKGENMPG